MHGLHDQDQHALVALDGVGDLDVGDADVELGGQDGDGGEGPGAVDAEARGSRPGPRRGRSGPAGPGGRCAPVRGPRRGRRGRRRRPGRGPGPARRGGGRARSRSRCGSRRRCRARCQGGRRRCGSCRGTRRRRAAAGPGARPTRSSARPIRVAAVRWGTWDTTATIESWRSGGSDTTSAPNPATTERDLGEGVVVGARHRREHPGATLEQVGPGAGDALLLAARHRMAAHVAGVVHEREQRGLHAAGVGDEAGRVGQGPPHLARDRADGCGHEGQLGVDGAVGVGDLVDDADAPRRRSRPARSRSRPDHVPAGAAQGGPDRTPDETDAHDEGTARAEPIRARRWPGRTPPYSGRSSRRAAAPSR